MNLLTRLLDLLKGVKMKVDTCHNCKDEIDEFNENEYFGINWKVYCSLGCFYEDDEKEKPTKEHREMMGLVNEAKKFLNKVKPKRQDYKTKNSSQTNKGNKRKNSLQSKRKKSKKRQR